MLALRIATLVSGFCLAAGLPAAAAAQCGSPVPAAGDADGDTVLDPLDNCINVRNAGQSDVDADGCGDCCDGDYDQTGNTTIADFNTLKACFGMLTGSPGPPDDPTCTEGDHDSTGFIGIGDFVMFKFEFGGPPGPSAFPLPPACF